MKQEVEVKLCKDALFVQDACNFSGVVYLLSRTMDKLCEEKLDSTARKKHPAIRCIMGKLCDMQGLFITAPQIDGAYEECIKIVEVVEPNFRQELASSTLTFSSLGK